MATGYEVIFGGWFNSKSIIARLDEHGKDMVERTRLKVVPGKISLAIERVGKKVTWWIDDMQTPFLVSTIRARSRARPRVFRASTTGKPIPGSTTS